MDIDPQELVKTPEPTAAVEGEGRAKSSNGLNNLVAITVALLATFMGVCKVKDDNIVQAMQQAQAERLDHWSYYQARVLRQEVAEATALQFKLAALDKTGPTAEAYREAQARYEAQAAAEAQKKQLLKAAAEADQQRYDALNFRDDQFDLSDAALAIAVAMLAVTALTGRRWLYGLALLPTAYGIAMGLAGLTGGSLHPDALIRLLS